MSKVSQIDIFDRNSLRQKRDKVISSEADFLFNKIAENTIDSLSVIKNNFPTIVNIGDVNKKISKYLESREGTDNVISADISKFSNSDIIIDDEIFPFEEASLDAVISSLMLQWVNDLPGCLLQIKRSLKPNSVFIGSMFGGETLKELRQSLMDAEIELSAGASPRVLPFVDAYDMSRLMQRAGFSIPVVDSEVITVKYSDMFKLMVDLKAMGATNIAKNRIKNFTRRELFLKAAEIYKKKFMDDNGLITASFDVTYFIGWTAVSK